MENDLKKLKTKYNLCGEELLLFTIFATDDTEEQFIDRISNSKRYKGKFTKTQIKDIYKKLLTAN